MKNNTLQNIEVVVVKDHTNIILSSDERIGNMTPEDYQFILKEIFDQYRDEKKRIVALNLDAKLNIINYTIVSVGSKYETVCKPREVFRSAIASGAYAVILATKNFSSTTQASQSDIQVCKQMISAGKVVDIKLTDFIIMSDTYRINSLRRDTGLFEQEDK